MDASQRDVWIDSTAKATDRIKPLDGGVERLDDRMERLKSVIERLNIRR